MEFQHSNVVDQATYRTEGLCDGIPLRLHNDSVKEIMGAIRAQRDWAKFVGPLGHYNGGLGERYSFVSVTVPECCPERLKIISYANEFAFLYDGSHICLPKTFLGANDPQMKWKRLMTK